MYLYETIFEHNTRISILTKQMAKPTNKRTKKLVVTYNRERFRQKNAQTNKQNNTNVIVSHHVSCQLYKCRT